MELLQVEASLLNGFSVGTKLETPLRDADNDKYWLATVVASYGTLLKLRYDGYSDNADHDFIVPCNYENIHPIGWCSKNQKALLPPSGL